MHKMQSEKVYFYSSCLLQSKMHIAKIYMCECVCQKYRKYQKFTQTIKALMSAIACAYGFPANKMIPFGKMNLSVFL